jgi:Tol biopolymer transport system component
MPRSLRFLCYTHKMIRRCLLILAAVLILSACSQPANIIPTVQSSLRCPRVTASDLHWLSDTQIAYVYPSITGDVYIVDVNTGESTLFIELTDIAKYRFMWSPDENYLLFTEGNGIWIVVDSAGSTVITIADVMYEPAWSPDSSQIVLIEDGVGIASIDLHGGERQQIFSGHESEITPLSVVWSPDGQYIAALAEDFSEEWNHSGWLLLVMRPDGTELRQFETEYLQSPLLWSPDGRWLAAWYLRPTMGGEPYALIEMSTGEIQTFTKDNTMPLKWLPDSSGFLAYLTDSLQIARVSLDGNATVIGPKYGSISPDDTTIAYVEGSDPAPDIYIANIDGSDARILANNPAPTVCFNP